MLPVGEKSSIDSNIAKSYKKRDSSKNMSSDMYRCYQLDGGEWVVWATTAEVIDIPKKKTLIVLYSKLEASSKGAKVSHQRCH